MPPSLWPMTPIRRASMCWALFEKFDAGDHVRGVVVERRSRRIAGGFAHAAVVHAQHCDAAARQVIRDHPKRFVLHQGFIAILRAGAGDHQRRWKQAGSARQRQRARELHPGGLIFVRDILGFIRKRRLRILRTISSFHFLDAFKSQGQIGALYERSFDFVAVEDPLVAGMQHGKFQMELVCGKSRVLPRNPVRALIDAVQFCGQRAGFTADDVDGQTQLDRSGVEGPQPGAFDPLGLACARECHEQNQKRPHASNCRMNAYRCPVIKSRLR